MSKATKAVGETGWAEEAARRQKEEGCLPLLVGLLWVGVMLARLFA